MKKINWDKVNKFIKSKNFVMGFCVFCLTMASIGFSYASFFSVKTNTSNQSVTTGTLSVSYGNDTSSVLRNGMNSISDEMGMAQDEASLIYIQNTGSLNSTFTLTVGYDMANFTGRAGYSEADTLTPIDYVMMAVYQYNGAGKEDTLVAGPLSIADLPIYSINTSDSRYNRYSLLFNNVGSSSSSTSTKTYKIKMWLSDKAIPAASYTYFYINTEVVAEVANAKMAYTLKGNVTSGTSNVNGATISFHNNSITSTTNSSGAFTLSGIYPGTYNVDITYNNEVYRGNLRVEEGSQNSLTSLGATFSGTDIYQVANNYGTTISKIIAKNNISTYSSAASISSGSLYPTYKFVGGATANVTGIKIMLNSTDKTFTMSM